MIVLDASVVVEVLIHGARNEPLRHAISDPNESFIAPHLLDVEVVSALRSLAVGRRIDATRVSDYFSGLTSLPVARYAHQPLLDRVWELRHNFTAYDAVYIALAEAMAAVLYTCDDKLVKGHRAGVRWFPPTGRAPA